MFGCAWLTIRQAQEALKNGRLEDAHRLLGQPAAQGHKGSWELLQQVAQRFVERGQRCLEKDDSSAAWNDLLAAEQVGAPDTAAARLRQELTRRGLTEARALVDAGEPARAAEILNQLRNRSVRTPELALLEEAAKGWALARELADRGEFAQAVQTAERARRLLPNRIVLLEEFQQDLERRRQAFGSLLVELHRVVDRKQWGEVVRLSEQVLAVAPQHVEARKARARAWKTVEPVTVAEAPRRHEPADAAQAPPAARQRFLLWIDGVGGYLVCLEPRITIGQATPDAYVDIPLFADVSRQHATLTRETEGYLLEALRPFQVNGQPAERVLLQSGDRVTLGSSCQIQFRQPVPVSTSARLDLVSGHRLPLTVDGVLLMADTLVLGPGSQVHVAMPDLQQPVVLFRGKDGLGVRHAGNFSIDGQRCRERGSLGPNATVTGEDFAFAVEPVGTRMGRA
jgi:tetratricopeptide (TPR) repeat protein